MCLLGEVSARLAPELSLSMALLTLLVAQTGHSKIQAKVSRRQGKVVASLHFSMAA